MDAQSLNWTGAPKGKPLFSRGGFWTHLAIVHPLGLLHAGHGVGADDLMKPGVTPYILGCINGIDNDTYWLLIDKYNWIFAARPFYEHPVPDNYMRMALKHGIYHYMARMGTDNTYSINKCHTRKIYEKYERNGWTITTGDLDAIHRDARWIFKKHA